MSTPAHLSPLRLGIMGCSSFALRAMAPAARKCPEIELISVASRDGEKAAQSARQLDCQALPSYEALIADPRIEAVYMPLPTGLHEEWVHKALDAGKHLLVEKSLACDVSSARGMLDHAQSSGLLLMENFLFLRHSQFSWVTRQLADRAIGDVCFFRAAFTIPPLPPGNFRYDPALGGGALLDVGAYMVKSVLAFFGEDSQLVTADLAWDEVRGVDIRGTATFQNSRGVSAQVLWGFDTSYQCSWEFIGASGRILCSRSLTPPPGFCPPVQLEIGQQHQALELPADDHYTNQWRFFHQGVRNPQSFQEIHQETLRQAEILDEIRGTTR